MFHSECHTDHQLPSSTATTDTIYRRQYATNLAIHSDLANLETRCDLDYPGDLVSRHTETWNNHDTQLSVNTCTSRSG